MRGGERVWEEGVDGVTSWKALPEGGGGKEEAEAEMVRPEVTEVDCAGLSVGGGAGAGTEYSTKRRWRGCLYC